MGIAYLLLNSFEFRFAEIPPIAAAIVAIVFLLIVGAITMFALHKWAPNREDAKGSKESSPIDALTFNVQGEKVVAKRVLATLKFDFVHIAAHTHFIGVAAEYVWILCRRLQALIS